MSQKPRKKLQKPEKYITESIKIEKIIPGGQALGTLKDGKKIFLWNALPGEIVTKAHVTKEKSSYIEGIAEEIAVKSSLRVEPRDACYLATSPWQILAPHAEIPLKRELVQENFRQQGIELEVNIMESADANGAANAANLTSMYGYRNKMEYALYYSHADSQIHLAFHERGSHRKVPVASSSLERPEIWQKAQAIIAELNFKQADARQYQSLLLRCNQAGEVSGGLFENHRPHPQFPHLTDHLLGVEYSYSPNGFFQINLPVYELALREIRHAIERYGHAGKGAVSKPEILDLYSGVGTIGLSVAHGHRLTLVECDRSAYAEMLENVKRIEEAREASKVQAPAEIRPVLAKSEDVLDYIASNQIVIVDPPRAGCRPEVIDRLLEVQPLMVIYLSCNPATEARDVKALLSAYEITSAKVFNFFPRTPHIESLIVLSKLK